MSLSRVLACALLVLVTTSAFAALNLPPAMSAEATSPAGAVVSFNASVVGGADGSDGRPADTVTCSPASNSTFPLGTTTVFCSGSEGSTGSFTVTVVDTTGPALTLPRDFGVVTTASSAVVTYSASATDIVDGNVAVTCTPPSGSTFSAGTTTVACSSSDTRGNTSTGTFDVTVSSTPVNPRNITAEATGPNGAQVNYDDGSGADPDGRPLPGSCSPANGSLFPLGTTTVTCSNGTFTITVVDTTGPVLTLPEVVDAVATVASGVAVTYSASAFDLVDGSVAVNCSPASGSIFPIGTTPVNCSATDSRSNTSTGSFDVVVTTNLPHITAEATGPNGAIVDYSGSCSPASGSQFPIGTTTVSCSTGTFLVIVVDTTPPALTLPGEINAEATSPAGAAVTFTASASDIVDGSVAVNCTPPSGSTFAFGESAVTCSATDAHGNTGFGTITIRIVDTTPPAFTSISASPNVLWPPNGKLTDIVISATVSDADPSPVVRIFNVTSNEAITSSDWSITGLMTLKLRADRLSSGTGRVYTVYVEAIDNKGNRSVATVTVTVPHDQSSPVTTPPPGRRRSAGHG